jgi:PKD repeat protein
MKNKFLFFTFFLFAAVFQTKFVSAKNISIYTDSDSIKYAGAPSIGISGNKKLEIVSPNAGDSYKWFRNNAVIPGATLSNYTATLIGEYYVEVRKNSTNFTKSNIVKLTEITTIEASFSFTTNGVCTNIPIVFTGTSTGNSLTYEWDFGDPNSGGSNTSTIQNPSHTFVGTIGSGNQNFNVKLTVTDNNGVNSIVTKVITTKQLPDANLGGTGKLTYNGLPYFRVCSPNPSNFTFVNLSSTNNIEYTIDWGDNSPLYTSNNFTSSLTHNYKVGIDTLTYTVKGVNGCVSSQIYYVFVGSNPAGNIVPRGNTTICTDQELTFDISGIDNNTPGTTYKITFNDGTSPITLVHPLIDKFITHKFTKNSCGASSSLANSFTVSFEAANPCGTTPGSAGGIFVSDKPKAQFDIVNQTKICVNNSLTFSNKSTGTSVTSSSCTNGPIIWKITPSTGWSIINGTNGRDFNQTDPTIWQTGGQNLNVRFTQPGEYKISLKIGTTSCGVDSLEKTICVNPTPTAAFDLDKSTGCAPLIVKTTNNSNTPICGNNDYTWSVTYTDSQGCAGTSSFSYLNSTSAKFTNPEFQFNNAGTYSISLTTKNADGTGCSVTSAIKTITVKAKPIVSINGVSSVCLGANLALGSTVKNCYSTIAETYLWSFPGANITSSNDAIPPNINYSTAGTKIITLDVTNECGTTTITKTITVNSAPSVNVISDKILCPSNNQPIIIFTNVSNISGVTYNWTRTAGNIGLIPLTGSSNIPSFNATNSGSTAITSTITVTPTLNGCIGTPVTFTITVNPSSPVANAGVDQKICNKTETVLSGNNPGTFVGTWTRTSGPADIIFEDANKFNTKVTGLTANQTYGFRWTITGIGSCPATFDDVVIFNRPDVTSANAGIDATVCDYVLSPLQNNTFTLQGNLNTSRAYETGTWTILNKPSGNTPTFSNNNPNNKNAILGNLIPGTYELVWTTSNDAGCISSTDNVIIKVYSKPTAGSTTKPTEICTGESITLSNTGAIGEILEWQYSLNINGPWISIPDSKKSSITDANVTTTRYYRFKIVSQSPLCNNTYFYEVGFVKVNLLSVGGTANGAQTLCSKTNSGAVNVSGNIGSVVRWESSSDDITFTAIPNSVNSTYNYSNIPATTYFRAVIKSGTCTEAKSTSVKITLGENAIQAKAGNDQKICNQTEVTLLGNDAGSFLGTWTQISGTAVTFEDANKFNTKVTGLTANQTYGFRWTITGIGSCPATFDDVVIFNRPDVTSANAGIDATVCDYVLSPLQNNTFTLQGNLNTSRAYETGTWTILNKPSGNTPTFSNNNPNNKNAILGNLIPGTYELVWTTSNDAGCISSTDNVIIKVYSKPTAGSTTKPTEICTGESITLSNTGAIGEILEWQYSLNINGPWISIPDSKKSSITDANVTTTRYYRFKIVSQSPLCNNTYFYEVGFVKVNLLSVGGTANGAQTLCSKTNSGAVNVSGNIGSVVRWESSSDDITFTAIPNSVNSTYNYSNIPATTYFRAVIKSGTCTEAKSTSVKITLGENVATANAGPNQTLCNFIGKITLAANSVNDATTKWTQISGPTISFDNDNLANSEVNITQNGTYIFEWEISNSVCLSSKSRVTIFNYPPLVNQITGSSTFCFGQQVTITGNTPTGGDGNYAYSWEKSIDNSSWQVITNETSKNLSFVTQNTIYVRRVVKSNVCLDNSTAVLITVLPTIVNNTVSANQEICIGKASQIITGSTPTGGNNFYAYSWEKSLDDNVWIVIAGITTKDYQPTNVLINTYFRRIVTSNVCIDAQKSTSNIVKITVRPNAISDFTTVATSACIPFNLASVITATAHPNENLSYEWFANGQVIGNTSSFPGYIITNDGDIVKIKLVTISKYGCNSDTKEITFSTTKNVVASFIKDKQKGCGPLTVKFTNNSSPLNGVSYTWDFGNGQTSNLANPPTIIFASHPLNRDTTYIIKLIAKTSCSETLFKDSITVRPKPVSIFSPDVTIGCSPLAIKFTNQSKGIPNMYTFDFGNGDKITKTDNSVVNYTYLTNKTDTFTVKLYAQNECGIDSSFYNIIVYPNTIKPELVIDGNSRFGCAPLKVKFYNNSEGANSFLWDFNDGTTSTTSVSPGTLDHIFKTPGTYIVKLTATNGCAIASTTEKITVYEQPIASFQNDKLQYCVGEDVLFTNSSPSNFTFIWDFSDGITSNEVNPKHKFSKSGDFNVKLTAFKSYQDGTLCSTVINKTISVISQPIATFTTNSNILNCAPFTLKVNATPSNSSGGVEWDFGDPSSVNNLSQGFSSSHTFTIPGVYKIKSIAYNKTGCADSTEQIIRITESPMAEFETADTLICGSSKIIQFNNKSTYGGTGILSYRWYINNTLISNQKNITYNFNTPTNVVLPFIYEVKLIVLSTIGCPDTVIHKVRFNPIPKADFSISKNIDCAPFIAKIINNSTFADNFKWYLNGVLVSTLRTPNSILLDIPNKIFNIKLVTGNIYGCRLDSIEKTISTYPKPKTLFSVNDSVSCNGKLDLITTNKSLGAASYIWNFGDTTPESTAISPKHTYGIPGTYKLRLISYNGFCRDTSIVDIKISPVPKAAYIVNKTDGCTKLDVQFQNISDNAKTYLWDFGDGSFSTSKNPLHTFNYQNSPFSIKLIAFGENGCADTTVKINFIRVSTPPQANFEILPDSIIKIPDYTFNYKNTSKGSPVKFLWDFGNGKISKEENPSHTYADTGAYKVKLIVSNIEGCTDTISKIVKINGVPGYLFIPNAFEPGNEKQEIRTFRIKGSGMSEFNIKIFNKWGELIWQSNLLNKDGEPIESWDGTMKGLPAPQGVYVWSVSAKFIDGSIWKGMKYTQGSQLRTGPLHLIR